MEVISIAEKIEHYKRTANKAIPNVYELQGPHAKTIHEKLEVIKVIEILQNLLKVTKDDTEYINIDPSSLTYEQKHLLSVCQNKIDVCEKAVKENNQSFRLIKHIEEIIEKLNANEVNNNQQLQVLKDEVKHAVTDFREKFFNTHNSYHMLDKEYYTPFQEKVTDTKPRGSFNKNIPHKFPIQTVNVLDKEIAPNWKFPEIFSAIDTSNNKDEVIQNIETKFLSILQTINRDIQLYTEEIEDHINILTEAKKGFLAIPVEQIKSCIAEYTNKKAVVEEELKNCYKQDAQNIHDFLRLLQELRDILYGKQ